MTWTFHAIQSMLFGEEAGYDYPRNQGVGMSDSRQCRYLDTPKRNVWVVVLPPRILLDDQV